MNFPITLLQLAMPYLWINTSCAAMIAVARAEDSDIDRDLSSPYLLRNHGNIRHRHQEIVENNESQLRRHRNEFRPHRLLRPEGALSWCRANSCSPISAARPHCDAATGMCVECLVDEHCHSLYDDKTLECVLDNVNSCKKKKHMAPIAMIRTESTMASSGSSSSSRLPSTDAPIPIPCLYDDECPAEEPICEDLSKGMCFNPPCGYCKSEAEISVTNPTIQAIKTTARATSTSTSREPIIPTTRSGIELASLWPNGNELADYTSCNFDCCTNEDCDSMADSNGRLIGGCCVEGTCQLMNRPDGICWDVIGPPADVICGYDAWMNYKGDGHCETQAVPTIPTSSSDPMKAQGSKTTIANFVTTTSPVSDITTTYEMSDMPDYSSCNFSCCNKRDCRYMVDSLNRIVGGCCVEGYCEAKSNPRDRCPSDVFADGADTELRLCGFDSWVAFHNDGCVIDDSEFI